MIATNNGKVSMARFIRENLDELCLSGCQKPSYERLYIPEGEYWHSGVRTGVASTSDWAKLSQLKKRYLRFVDYIREVKPRWTQVEVLYYADNSAEAVERSADGRTRTRMITAPSGDLCY